MTLRLTPEMLERAYDFLRTTPPFRGWSLPDADAVEFHVSRKDDCFGWFIPVKIGVSERNVGHTATLVRIMAHEMIHLYQHLIKSDRDGVNHNANWRKLANQVCRHHGFDPKSF
jgi:hypothetical protein